jgi:hypothetical protein
MHINAQGDLNKGRVKTMGVTQKKYFLGEIGMLMQV